MALRLRDPGTVTTYVADALGTAALATLAVRSARPSPLHIARDGVTTRRTLPAVGDAEQRVATIERRHHGRDTGLPLPARLAAATVAIEDERFYTHGAIDALAIGRAAWSTATSDSDPGGSTITQQLAKALYVRSPESLAVRLQAIGLATKLEQRYSERRILEMYLNAIYYGHGYWGARQASRGYFGVSVDRLTWGRPACWRACHRRPAHMTRGVTTRSRGADSAAS